MKVILLENVERVGKQGEILNVRDGYARNFLLPRKLALIATERQLKRVEEVRKLLAARQARATRDLADRVAQLEQVTLKAELRVGAEGKAFGAITNVEIAELLAQSNFEVDKHDVLMPEPIKETGVHDVVIHVGPETKATIKIWVTAQPVEGASAAPRAATEAGG
jgi:large subunit ribosomal protein L9